MAIDASILLLLDSSVPPPTTPVLTYHIESIKQKIINYCSIDVFPTTLEYIVVEIVLNKLQGDLGNVKSVTRGDTKTDFATSDSNILNPYVNDLDSFRRVRMV